MDELLRLGLIAFWGFFPLLTWMFNSELQEISWKLAVTINAFWISFWAIIITIQGVL